MKTSGSRKGPSLPSTAGEARVPTQVQKCCLIAFAVSNRPLSYCKITFPCLADPSGHVFDQRMVQIDHLFTIANGINCFTWF